METLERALGDLEGVGVGVLGQASKRCRELNAMSYWIAVHLTLIFFGLGGGGADCV